MEHNAGVSDPLALLLSTSNRAARSSILVAATADEAWANDRGTVVPDRDLPRRIKTPEDPKKPAAIVVLGRLSPTLLRALRAKPPALVVVTGDANIVAIASLDALPKTRALGPHARLRVGAGNTVACADHHGELAGLRRSLGEDSIRLALAPTPAWLPQWLAQDLLAQCPVAGTVHASALGVEWARWAADHAPATVLVPVGLPLPQIEPGHASLPTVVAAHALECLTGPVFPSPRVIATVLTGLQRGRLSDRAAPQDAPEPNALWAQARRALPITGAVVGMDQPAFDVGASPTAGFLAQRALLRAFAAGSLRKNPQALAPEPDPDGVERAEQLLANAGEILTDHESKVVLRGFGIEVTRQAVASSASGATGFAERIGYPVVLKALSPDLRRRGEIDAIALQLGTGAAVRRAYASIVDNVEQRAPTARLDGVLVAEMVPTGLDVRCGVVRLPDDQGLAIYGHTTQGAGTTEAATALLPLDAASATLFAHAILTQLAVPGLRRADDPDVHSLAAVLLALANVARVAADRIESIELAPLRLVSSPRRSVVIDATIRQRPHLEGA